MRYVTVPKPVFPTTFDGKPFKETETDDDGKKTSKEIGEISTHRWLMVYIVNDLFLTKNEAGQVTAAVLKISRALTNGNWGQSSGYKGNRRTGKLDDAFASAKPGDVVAIDEDDWEVVKKIIEEKEWSSASFGKCFLSFEQAWMDAKDKAPEALKPVPADGQTASQTAQA